MKKILLLTLAGLASLVVTATSATAKDTITVVNPSNKASPATVFAKR